MTQTKIFGITPIQQRIIQTLQEGRAYKVTALATMLHLPRTTIEYNLRLLKDYNLIEQIKIQNHPEWRLRQTEHLLNKISDFIALCNLNNKTSKTISCEGISIELSRTREELENRYFEISSALNSSHIFAIQGHQSAIKQFDDFSLDFFKKIHQQQKKNKIILEGVTSQGAWNNLNNQTGELIRSHFGRATILYVVPDNLINFDLDIIFANKTLYFMNPRQGTCICIKNQSLYNALMKFLEIYKIFGKKIDLNAHIKELSKNNGKIKLSKK